MDEYKLIDISTEAYPNSFLKVDPEDYARLSQYKWKHAKGTAVTMVEGKEVKVSRLIMNIFNYEIISHRNGDKLDNRRENLLVIKRDGSNINKDKKHLYNNNRDEICEVIRCYTELLSDRIRLMAMDKWQDVELELKGRMVFWTESLNRLSALLLILILIPVLAFGQSSKANPKSAEPQGKAKGRQSKVIVEPPELDVLDIPIAIDYTDAILSQLANEHEQGVILIKFRPRSQFTGQERQYDQTVNKVTQMGFEGYLGAIDVYYIKSDELKRNPSAVYNRLKNNRFVEWVEPNFLGHFD